MHKNCPFCDKDNPRNHVIKRSRYSYVLFSNPWKSKGHILIIPNRHITRISDLKPQELKEIMTQTVYYEKKFLKHVPGLTIEQNYQPYVPDGRTKVAHLHVHLIPRRNNDGIYEKGDDVFKTPTKKEISDWSKKLK